MIGQIICDCGWSARGTEEELVAAAQQQGGEAHDMVPNPEQVLAGLKTAGLVTEALDLDPDDVLEERYDSIQRALFEAVHAVHVPWVAVAEEHVSRLFKILRRYRFVYSTNYDLLLYWASMDDGGTGFLDYFWGDGGTFDVFDTDIWPTKACTAASSSARSSGRRSSSGTSAPAGMRQAEPATCTTLSSPGLCARPSINVPPTRPSRSAGRRGRPCISSI